jgi:oxaloacetate decarboxylase alpha subunit
VILILEAMKMETEVRAPMGGRVVAVPVKEGGCVQVGDPLVMLA